MSRKTNDSEACCGGDDKKTILVYACSGGANVAEVADRAARELSAGGEAAMFCLAGLGAEIEPMVQTARAADLNIVIDGCAMDCGKAIFDRLGMGDCVQVRVTDLGIEKTKGVRATDGQVRDVVERTRAEISRA